VDLTGYGWAGRRVPLDKLRAIAARRLLADGGEALDAFGRAMDDERRTTDVLIAVTERGVQTVSCIVTAVSEDGVAASVGGRERAAGWDRCVGIVLSTAGSPRPGGRLHRLRLRDGTAIALDSFAVEDGLLTGRAGPAEYSVDCSRLGTVRVASESYAYLSDLPVESVESGPQLDVVWPHRMDLAVTGAPLALGGVEYPKGIGMHPRTALSFGNGGGFDRLLAVVGLDDAADDRGSVRFLVLADGRAVLDTGPLTGADEPRRVEADVTGARTVTVAVEPADPLVLSGNLADWCDARLVRMASAAPEGVGRDPAAR
jgi:hypothetical protein